eukprot:s2702_g16.t1
MSSAGLYLPEFVSKVFCGCLARSFWPAASAAVGEPQRVADAVDPSNSPAAPLLAGPSQAVSLPTDLVAGRPVVGVEFWAESDSPAPEWAIVEQSEEFVFQLTRTTTAAELSDLLPPYLDHFCIHQVLISQDPHWTPRARIARAFRAGVSAHRVLQGLFDKQATSPCFSIRIPNKVYVVARLPISKMASGGNAEPLTFDILHEKILQVAAKRVLPTAVLTGTLGDQEVRILAHLLRCRPSGFMVLLPVLEEVLGVLEQLVDDEGNSLVAQKEVEVPLEDSAGRKFGTGAMLLVDFMADAAAQFARTPALRGSASSGLLRMMVRGAVARPASRGALQAAETWIAEMAELDDNLHEYFTGEEGDAFGDSPPLIAGEAEGFQVSADVVQQLQERIAQLEAQQAAPTVTAPPLPDLEPRPHGPGRSVLFSPSALGGSVAPDTMQRLRALAGPAPQRLSKSEAPASAPSAAQDAFAELEAGADAEDEVSKVLNSASDPLHQLLALQMKQTAALMQRLLPAAKDPVSAALCSEGGSSQSGVKGCVARDAYLKTMEDVKQTGKLIATNAANDLGLPADQVNSGLMRSYVEKRMPLGDQRQLTYMAQFLAVSWQMSYEAKNEFSMGLMARGLMMVEQLSIDQGRCQFGWLLSAMPDPNLQSISQNRRRIGLTPYAKLAAAPWVAGNIAYLKDLDYLEGRLKNPKLSDKPSKEDPADEEAPKGTRRPWKPKKAQAKAKAESSESAAA